MLPSRALSSHPRRDASLPCPRSADSTTATSAAQRSRRQRPLARRKETERDRGARAMLLLPAAPSTCAHVQHRWLEPHHRQSAYPIAATIGTADRALGSPPG